MQTLYALRERHSALAKELRALVDNKDAKWTEESQAKYDQGLAEMDDIKAQMDRIQSLNERIADDRLNGQIEDAAGRRMPGAENAQTRNLFAAWLRGGDNAITAQEWAQIRAAMSTGVGAEGGFIVQKDVVKSVMDALKLYGGVRAVASIIQTESGNPFDYPTSDGTSEEGELVGENATATDLDVSFGVLPLVTYKFSSKTVAVPIELLQDSAVDVEAFVRQRLVTRIGRSTNKFFTTGTGTAQPRGVVTAATSGKVGATGQTATVTFDDFVDLIHSCDPAYRALGCEFMMHDNSLRQARKLKDSQGRPIFLPGFDGLSGKMSDQILGYDVVTNQDMPTMAANAKSILFGCFDFYVIRDVMALSLHRFTDSAFAKKGQVGFLMFSRHGGQFTDVGGALRFYQNSAA